MIMLRPTRELGMVLGTNADGKNTDPALRAVAEDLYGRFGQDL
jgi:hypothetical protein